MKNSHKQYTTVGFETAIQNIKLQTAIVLFVYDGKILNVLKSRCSKEAKIQILANNPKILVNPKFGQTSKF